MEETKEVKPVKKETVTVDKVALEGILDRIKVLEATQDKTRLAWYQGLNPNAKKETVVTVGSFPTAKGFKLIKGWTQLPLNEMYQDTNGAWHERQVMKLILEGDEELEVSYLDFVRRKVSVKANVVGRSIDEATGNQTLKIMTVDGKKLDIDVTFINI